MKTPKSQPKCPICSGPSARDYAPFCSRRCADVDLSRWLSGRYVIPGPPEGAEEREGVEKREGEDPDSE